MHHDSRAGMFFEELALLLDSGMVLGDALEILADEQADNSAELRILRIVQSGSTLGDAVGEVFSSLPSWILSVIHATESASVPQAGLSLISNHLKKEAQWRSSMQRSLSYPVVLLAATILVGIVVMRSIMPTLADMVAILGGAVPLTTRIALYIGSIVGSPVAIVLWSVAAGIVLWIWSGRGDTSEYVIRIPVVKRLVYLSEAWRFFSINGILLSAGMPLHEALNGAATVLNSTILSRGARRVAELVQGGASVQIAIKEMSWLPVRTSKVLAVAVAAGSVSSGFGQLASWAEIRRNAILHNWNTWLPVLLLCVATILIGFLAHAILIPGLTIDLGP